MDGLLGVLGAFSLEDNMVKKSNADRLLSVKLEGSELVIRIGVNSLAFVCEWMDSNYDGENDCPAVKVTNKKKFAKDVVRALLEEAEDGTTLVHYMLDKAIDEAIENGSEWVSLPGEV